MSVPDSMGPYRIGALICRGREGTEVYECSHPERRERLAIKVIKKAGADMQAVDDECAIMREIDCPQIMPALDIVDLPEYRAIVMPLAIGGDLFDKIQDGGGLDERIACQVIYDMLEAIKYLHTNGIWHRNIKPENTLLMDDSDACTIHAALGGFGFARRFSEGETCEEYLGTEGYMAPEMYMKKPYDQRVDIWSMGVTMFVVLSGETPWDLEDKRAMVHRITHGQYDFDSERWQSVSEEAKDLIRQMMKVNPEERISAADALKHPWFAKFAPNR
ncbi:MAG TPA: protein kinase [Methanocorpusculum sp.]|nr:protein kinase [Methanocorpusculum sp.]